MAAETRPFNAASFNAYLTGEKRLMGVRCRTCGMLSPEPRPLCRACHSRDLEWHEFSGMGELSTFTCISIGPVYMVEQGFDRSNPYCSGIVTLEEGPRISARILGVDGSNPQNIRTGMGLVLALEDIDPEHPALMFRPA